MSEIDPIQFEKAVYKVVQKLIVYLSELKKEEGILAVYILRSDETGKLSYYSYKQKGNIYMRRVNILIKKKKEQKIIGIRDQDWFPLLIEECYSNECDCKYNEGFSLPENKIRMESFRIFDKTNDRVKYPKFSEYLTEYFKGRWVQENQLYTDFPYFDGVHKKSSYMRI